VELTVTVIEAFDYNSIFTNGYNKLPKNMIEARI